MIAFLVFLGYKHLNRLETRDVERVKEMLGLRKYVKETVSGFEHLSFRTKKESVRHSLPSPPSTPPHVRDSMDHLKPDDTLPIEEPEH